MDLNDILTHESLHKWTPYITPVIYFNDNAPHYTFEDVDNGTLGLDSKLINNTRPEVFKYMQTHNLDDSFLTESEISKLKEIYENDVVQQSDKPRATTLLSILYNRMDFWHLKTLEEKCIWVLAFWSYIPATIKIPDKFPIFKPNDYHELVSKTIESFKNPG